MKVVDKALQPPGKCIVSGDSAGPFIDTGVWGNQVDPYIYLHVPVVEFMARELLGMIGKAEFEELAAKLESVSERLAEAQEVMEKLKGFEDAIEALKVQPQNGNGQEEVSTAAVPIQDPPPLEAAGPEIDIGGGEMSE